MDANKKSDCMSCKLYRSKERWKSIKRFALKHFYTFMHIVVLVSLSFYIFSHWKLCVSMQFFSSFDGNNILFLSWIALIFLLLYRVEGKGIKVDRRIQEDEDNLNKKRLEYKLNELQEIINTTGALQTSIAQDMQTQVKEDEANGSGN